MAKPDECLCCEGPKLIFPCSGAADVGAIADQAARKMTQDGVGRMFCLAGIGGRVNNIMKSTEAASKILAIDACPADCASRCLKEAGFTTFLQVQLADIGLEKGKSPVSEENIAMVVARGQSLLEG
jgi:uncharacterized metal-binding protein